MSWLIQRLRTTASESQLALMVGLCAVIMSAMLCAIVWQSSIIAEQRMAIRWFMHWQ